MADMPEDGGGALAPDYAHPVGGKPWVFVRRADGRYTGHPARAEVTGRADALYRAYSERMARLAESGEAPWMRERDASHRPPAGLGGEPWRGPNAVLLAAAADARGYDDPRWGSRERIEDLGGRVARGEEPVKTLAWRFAGRGDGHEWPTRVFAGEVYNAGQCRGLPPDPRRGEPVVHGVRDLLASPEVRIADSGGTARYDPGRDLLELPPRDRFASEAAYCRVALHELGHWTGHPDRLGRASLAEGIARGHDSPEYAREELRAGIHSYLSGCESGLGHAPADHARFAGEWARALRADSRELFRAAWAARRIDRCLDDLSRREWLRRVERSVADLAPSPGPVLERTRSDRDRGRER